MSKSVLTQAPRGVILNVLASAGSSRSAVRGIHGNALKVAVRAAPEKGKANAEITEVLAEFFGTSIKSVRLIAGDTSRNKRFEIDVPLVEAQRIIDSAV